MFAALEFVDLCQISLIVMFFAGSSTIYTYFRPADKARLRRLEEKVDLLLKHSGIGYEESIQAVLLSDEVEGLAQDPDRKAEAIALHSTQAKVSTEAATKAVEAFIVSINKDQTPAISDEVAALAQNPEKKAAAIDLYIQQTGATHEQATRAVEAYLAIGRKEPVPVPPLPCPGCGKPLATPNAQQCFECGLDWHGKPMPK